MLKKITIAIIIVAVALTAAMLLYVRDNETPVPPRTVIAHAGGAIDSLTYTNSLEAVQNAVARGVKFIELDIVISPEGEPLAFHSSPDVIDTIYSCDPPHMDEFVKEPIRARNGKTYTKLTWREINKLFLDNPNLILVVDKTDDPQVLEKYFPKLKKRMIVECFSMERFVEVSKRGFMMAMLSEEAFSPAAVLKQDLKHLFGHDEPRVTMLAMGKGYYNAHRKARWFIKIANLGMAMWTAQDRQAASQTFETIPQATMVYTNNL